MPSFVKTVVEPLMNFVRWVEYLGVQLEDFIRRFAHEKSVKSRAGDWFFHHDNAPVHTALSVKQFLAKNGMTPIANPPYSPDLAPYDFFLFPRLKKDMKGKLFATVKEVKQKSPEGLNNIPINEFTKCFEQ